MIWGGLILALCFALAGDLPAQEKRELNVVVHERWFAGFRYLEQTAREFEAAHPGVQVNILSSASAAGGEEKVKFMLAGKLPLDVTWIDVTEFAAFLQEGVLLDLQPYFDADPTWNQEDYFPQVLDAMRDTQGHLYGLPSTFTPYVMYVNKTLLESEGLALPGSDWTWDDLQRICKAATKDTDDDGQPDQWGISITQWLQALSPWIWQNGGRFLNDAGQCALGEPAAVEAMEYLVRMLHHDKVAADDATFENQLVFSRFQTGRTAFYGPVGYWETYRFKDIASLKWNLPEEFDWQETKDKGIGEQRKWLLPRAPGGWASLSYVLQDRGPLETVVAAHLHRFLNPTRNATLKVLENPRYPTVWAEQQGDLLDSQGRTWPQWQYLAAIVQAPQGNVLIHVLGPQGAVRAVRQDFLRSLQQVEVQGFAWDVLPLPRGKQAATAVAMRFYVVPQTSRHPQLAYEFVRALASATMQNGLAEIGNGVPGLKASANSSSFLKPLVPPHSEHVFLDALPDARFLPIAVNWREIEKRTKAILEEAILLGRQDARTVCVKAAQAADEILAREERLKQRPLVPKWIFPVAQILGLGLLIFVAVCLFVKRRSRLLDREERAAWLFLTPWALGFVFFLVGPAAVAAVLSFSEWNPVRSLDGARWMGTAQYQRLLQDETFHDSFRVTAVYALLAVPLQMILALVLALLLRHSWRGSGAFRTLFYLPTIISPVILGAVWRWVLAEEGGVLNAGLGSLRINGPDWLGDPTWVIPSFAIMSLWTVGAQMLVFLAGLQGIPGSLYEAARIDGANAWQRFRTVTFPALSPIVLFNLIVALIQAFQLFAQPFVMTQGGPGNESRFLVLYLFEQGFRFHRMGYASALAWALFLVVLILTLVVLRSSSRWVHYAGAGR